MWVQGIRAAPMAGSRRKDSGTKIEVSQKVSGNLGRGERV